MNLDCKIKVNGEFSKEKSSIMCLLSNGGGHYDQIYKHVKKCQNGCTPDLVLTEYLKLDNSINLCKIAARYEKIGASSSIVDEFFMRSQNLGMILKRDLPEHTFLKSVKSLFNSWKHRDKNNFRVSDQEYILFRIDWEGEKWGKLLDRVNSFTYDETNEDLCECFDFINTNEIAKIMFS